MIKQVPIKDLHLDPALQMRVGLCQETLKEYTTLLQDGQQLGVVEVYDVEGRLCVVDGFHRVTAHKRAGLEKVEVRITEGDRREALLAACQANKSHGLRRTRSDRHKALRALLVDDEWRCWSDETLARMVGFSRETVRLARITLEVGGVIPKEERRTYTDAEGNTRTMDTSGITNSLGVERDPFTASEEDGDSGEAYTPPSLKKDQEEREKKALAECGPEEGATLPPEAPDTPALSRPLPQHSSESQEWYTPRHILSIARTLMDGIDLDPASCVEANEAVQARAIYTREMDGLGRPWSGRVWLNPPYGTTGGRSNAGVWAEEMVTRFLKGEIEEGILLVNASTGARWFKGLWGFPICFPSGRLRFVPPGGAEAKAPTHYSALVFVAPTQRWGAFALAFGDVGHVVMPGEVG